MYVRNQDGRQLAAEKLYSENILTYHTYHVAGKPKPPIVGWPTAVVIFINKKDSTTMTNYKYVALVD